MLLLFEMSRRIRPPVVSLDSFGVTSHGLDVVRLMTLTVLIFLRSLFLSLRGED
jgi:hypothetical protein